MNFLNKMERKYGRYALRNLPEIMIGCYALGYVLQLFFPEILGYLTLEPVYILRGQIWRLVTWVVVPPYSFDLFTIITLFFYFSIARTLESTWGAFRFNVYIFSGILFTALGAFLLYGVLGGGFRFGSYFFSTYYINIPGLCCDLSRYAGAFVFPVSHKDEMDGTDLRGIYSGRIYTGILD